MICPNCKSADTQGGFNNRFCINCGQHFNEEGPVDTGADQSTRDALLQRLEPRKPVVTGNYADLQRAGADAASGGKTGLGDGVALPGNLAPEHVQTPAEADKAQGLTTVETVRVDGGSDLPTVQSAPEPTETSSSKKSK